MENKILIGTLTECHADHLIISGVKIEVTERASVDQFPIGATLAETTRNVWALLTSPLGSPDSHQMTSKTIATSRYFSWLLVV